jgi:hypothetical protein
MNFYEWDLSKWDLFYFQLLENALRKYPSSTPERWDRISEEVPGRTKKECMRRYKVRFAVEIFPRVQNCLESKA